MPDSLYCNGGGTTVAVTSEEETLEQFAKEDVPPPLSRRQDAVNEFGLRKSNED